MKKLWIIAVSTAALSGITQASFVTISDIGNTADPYTGYGAVTYEYKISRNEVTIAEFQQATGAGSGDENYWNGVGVSAPASRVSLHEAMKYCNWLTSGDVNQGAYSFWINSDYAEDYVVDRQSAILAYGTIYVIPTEDEWYKAAYYTGNPDDCWSLYANGTDTAPTASQARYNDPVGGTVWAVGSGTEEQNGTYDMMGNVMEWVESPLGIQREAVTMLQRYTFALHKATLRLQQGNMITLAFAS